jgi:hypothetical protein
MSKSSYVAAVSKLIRENSELIMEGVTVDENDVFLKVKRLGERQL